MRKLPSFPLLSLFLVLFVALALALAGSAPVTSAAPATVTIAGDMQSEAGCADDWNPGCATTHIAYDANSDVWKGTLTIDPAGSYHFKAALNDSWDLNYGRYAQQNGPDIPTNLPGGAVKFYYDDKSHWVTDNQRSVIANVAGSFQSELGCSGDWQENCLRAWLQDPGETGIYSFETTALPKGTYEGKVTINESWDENYGLGGVFKGPNIPFTVSKDNQRVVFLYDPNSHLLTIQATHAHDNNVEYNGLAHDSRDTLYRTPGGAVPAGTDVKIRFRTFHNDVTDVLLRLWDVNANAESKLPMSIVASDVSCYDPKLVDDSCDFWEATLKQAKPNNLWYRFIVQDGTSTAYYADDTDAMDGGLGAATPTEVDNSYAVMFHVSSFQTPDWMSDAIVYQIFPDRFRNGNLANDPTTGDPRYDMPVITMNWNDLPEGYCRDYANADPYTCGWRNPIPPGEKSVKEVPEGRDYYGGDLKGVTLKLDYLKTLGVNTIYFNPIFAAKSNHRYDTANYKQIDPYLGTLQDFTTLVTAAKSRGMRIILDGVFNHMSSDSPQFDRYHHYGTTGACESATSSWRKWFTFIPPTGSQPGPCAPTTFGGSDTYYQGWWGFDSIPVLDKTKPSLQTYFLTATDSVSRYWLNQGASGWRLDVMNDGSFPNGYWETFRRVVKSTDPNAIIVGELWQKDSSTLRYLRGDRADSAMGYRFRDVMMVWLSPNDTFDGKGFKDSGHQVSISKVAARLLSIREDYPDTAYFSMMNILDSHDTERVAWTLAPGALSRTDREFNVANRTTGELNQKIASLIEFSVGGAPTIYYGDEVGMTGNTDPDDRRTFPWVDLGGTPDYAMLQHYQKLAQVRKATPALTNGTLRVLLTDEASRTLVLGRKTNKQAAVIVAGNGGAFDIPVAGYLPDGTLLKAAYAVNNPYTGVTATVAGGKLHVDLANKGGIILVSDANADLTPPPAPTGVAVLKAGDGFVSLRWNPVAGAAGYNVYYSPVSGGGWVKANTNPVTAPELKVRMPALTAFQAEDLTNAARYYFVVRALDAVGNESVLSAEVSATPHLGIDWANVQWPYSITRKLTTTPTETVYGRVRITGVTAPTGPEPTLRAQVGFGPKGTYPATNAKWVWTEATFNVINGDNYEYQANMLPSAVGDYIYVYRYSTSNGAAWVYADQNGIFANTAIPTNPGVLTVTTPDDTTPPGVPANLVVTSYSPVAINLGWDASVESDSGIYQYEVVRSSAATGPWKLIGTTTATTYGDTLVKSGATYYYKARAVDNAFNRSNYTPAVKATAVPRKVTVVFTVTVPAYTDASGKQVHIAGTLSRLDGGLPDWDKTASTAGFTRTDSTHWTITLIGNEGTQIEYKYALGPAIDWDYVEKYAGCGELNNRTLTLAYGTDGTQNVNDTVENWRNSNQFGGTCGN